MDPPPPHLPAKVVGLGLSAFEGQPAIWPSAIHNKLLACHLPVHVFILNIDGAYIRMHVCMYSKYEYVRHMYILPL